VKSKKKTYRVAARHEIIARFLCQAEDNKYSKKAYSEAYNKFRQDTLDQMYEDDELWDEVMGRVGGERSKRDDAIRLYYNDTHTSNHMVISNWLDPCKATCIKSNENCISKEKIIY